MSALRAITNPVTWILVVPYFCYYMIGNAYIFWAPLLIRGALGTRDVMTGLVAAVLALAGAAAYLIAAARSDRSAERCAYITSGLALSTLGCLGLAMAPSPMLRIAALALIPIGSAVFGPAYWCLPPMVFGGTAAAAAIALITAVGSTGGDTGAFLMLSGIGIVGCLVCLGLRQNARFARRAPG